MRMGAWSMACVLRQRIEYNTRYITVVVMCMSGGVTSDSKVVIYILLHIPICGVYGKTLSRG